jgi:hypothetical protein
MLEQSRKFLNALPPTLLQPMLEDIKLPTHSHSPVSILMLDLFRYQLRFTDG